MIELNKIYQGNTLEVLKTWPDEFIQCVVTSPPYWGLRDYGCEGQIGLESTPDEYVEKIVEVFSHVRRCLKKDGVLWLNLGDSYSGSNSGYAQDNKAARKGFGGTVLNRHRPSHGMMPKQLIGIPWRVAFALQNDGWYLRSDIVWSKPNPMPESVTDRPTKAHEYIFLLSKSQRYFYDADAIKEPSIYFDIDPRPSALERARLYDYDTKEKHIRTGIYKDARSYDGKHTDKQRGHGRRHAGFNDRWDQMSRLEQCSSLRNKRSVWSIPTYPFPGTHFATFPEYIPSICIKAGSRPGDIILDPFMGSGTVGVVAKRFKRNFVGIELNPKYIKMAEKRIRNEHEPLLVEGVAS